MLHIFSSVNFRIYILEVPGIDKKIYKQLEFSDC